MSDNLVVGIVVSTFIILIFFYYYPYFTYEKTESD